MANISLLILEAQVQVSGLKLTTRILNTLPSRKILGQNFTIGNVAQLSPASLVRTKECYFSTYTQLSLRMCVLQLCSKTTWKLWGGRPLWKGQERWHSWMLHPFFQFQRFWHPTLCSCGNLSHLTNVDNLKHQYTVFEGGRFDSLPNLKVFIFAKM
jgi:hypothetical protein